jgi:hypothetical protein
MAKWMKIFVEGLVTTLNAALTKSHYRQANIAYEADNDVECAVKIMLGKLRYVSLGEPSKVDHYGWIYFDFGSNHQRNAEKIIESIEELVEWLDTNYDKGLGYDIGSGYYIREMQHIPFQGYPKPKEQFLQEMILVEFRWERR